MQKIIICDSTCIGYLIRISCLNLLEIIYGEIIIPEAVFNEILQLENSGYLLDEFKNANWIKVNKANNLSNVLDYRDILDKGELEAISIAIELKADLLIIDEKLGRIVATNLGLNITGLVGILIIAKNDGLLLSIKKTLDKVIVLGCRISEKLYNIALKSCNE